MANEFYESIKNLKFYKNKYFFWLQYGISAIEMKELEIAEIHFKAAYANCPDNMDPLINRKYLVSWLFYNKNANDTIVRCVL